MPESSPDKLLEARHLIERVLTPPVLTIIGQEFRAAYFTAADLERQYFHYSTHKETSPIMLRGLLETALMNIASNIGGAECRTVPNAGNTSYHNELILAGQIVLSAARCHPWTGQPGIADFRRAQSVRNGEFMFPEELEVPDVTEGRHLTGYFEHLPGSSHLAIPQIGRLHFPVPDFLAEITTIDLKPYLRSKPAEERVATIVEIEEEHNLELLENEKTN